jgi:hypothetical protein
MQLNDTTSATPGGHAGCMVTDRLHKILKGEATTAEPITLELNPWREVGWIFKDGEAVAIERLGDESRVRLVEL